MYCFESISFQCTDNLSALQSRELSLFQPLSELFSSLIIKEYCMHNSDGIRTTKCVVIKYILCFLFQNHGVMEGNLFYTLPVCGKLFWKYFYAGSHYSFDVYKPVMVSLDQQPPCGYVAHTSCGKLHTKEGSLCSEYPSLVLFQHQRFGFQGNRSPWCSTVGMSDLRKKWGKQKKIEIQTFMSLKKTLIKNLTEN